MSQQHRCKPMKDELELFFKHDDDKSIPISCIEKGGQDWFAGNKTLRMRISFCPFCGINLSAKDEMWVIEFTSPDPACTFTNAYPSREKALEAAGGFIEYQAKEELDGIGWQTDEAPTLLKAALEAVEAGRLEDAVSSWLEYQDEYDPSDRIAIGPSGQTSGRSMDFRKEKT